jgi:type I restriction enzyme, R subunit
MPTEADTCRTCVLPALYRAGWTDEQIREQVTFTPGRIIVAGGKVHRSKRKRLDYMLSFQPDLQLRCGGGKRYVVWRGTRWHVEDRWFSPSQ